ncbi:hypothetical protein D0Z03_002465 [Geotrichum reessii]|nr:hypothetical protein D0Z03_002465 [Galactomyces reessii]
MDTSSIEPTLDSSVVPDAFDTSVLPKVTLTTTSKDIETTINPGDLSNTAEQQLKRKRSPELTTNAIAANEDNDDAKPDVTNSSTNIVPSNPPQLLYTHLKTGFCYDVRMRYHAKIVTSAFDYVDPHPEDPRRIYRVYKALAESGIIIDPKLEGLEKVGDLMLKIPIRFASDDEILLVHTKAHLDFIKSTTTMTRQQLIEETEKGDSVYFNNDSYTSALLSCGGAIEVCKAVVERKVKNALAIVRPPGHHAESGNAAGFCMFSNVAVTAKTMLRDYPETIRRILILDWDVHHGNGTQRAFYNDPRVLYISLHRYEGGKFYPGTDYAAHNMSGEGEGRGFNLNIPWSSGGMGDGDYIYAMNKVIMPIAIEYDPDLVIISSGFDAAEGDPIGGCHLSPNAYGYLTHMMKVLANGNLVVVMEGGYNLDSIAKSALAVTKVLIGEILVTPEIHSARTIVVIVHDTPEIWASRRPILGTIDPSQSLMIDASRQIIDWATSQDGFGVVDVSVPGVAGVSHNSSYSIGASAQDLCIYLWDDYIEYFSATNIVFIGVGEAYSGIVYLAGHRDLRTRVKSIIAFVDDIPLRAIAPVIDEYISDWFYHNSLVFTSNEHTIWDPSVNPKKPRRKFGRVIRSNSVGTARVARERFEEAREYIEDMLDDEAGGA